MGNSSTGLLILHEAGCAFLKKSHSGTTNACSLANLQLLLLLRAGGTAAQVSCDRPAVLTHFLAPDGVKAATQHGLVATTTTTYHCIHSSKLYFQKHNPWVLSLVRMEPDMLFWFLDVK